MRILTVGERYDVAELRMVGWTIGDGSATTGYNFGDYFDADGAYRGPDAHGIEPVFDGENPPELLAACIAAHRAIEMYQTYGRSMDREALDAASDSLRAAIRKAEGGAE